MKALLIFWTCLFIVAQAYSSASLRCESLFKDEAVVPNLTPGLAPSAAPKTKARSFAPGQGVALKDRRALERVVVRRLLINDQVEVIGQDGLQRILLLSDLTQDHEMMNRRIVYLALRQLSQPGKWSSLSDLVARCELKSDEEALHYLKELVVKDFVRVSGDHYFLTESGSRSLNYDTFLGSNFQWKDDSIKPGQAVSLKDASILRGLRIEKLFATGQVQVVNPGGRSRILWPSDLTGFDSNRVTTVYRAVLGLSHTDHWSSLSDLKAQVNLPKDQNILTYLSELVADDFLAISGDWFYVTATGRNYLTGYHSPELDKVVF